MDNIINTLNIDDLHAVLQAIRYANPLPKTSLHDHLIDQRIVSTGMPILLQDYHITAWISDMITGQYNSHRYYHGLPTLSPATPKNELIEHVRQDYLLSNTDLESWSVMFIRYACPFARISTDEHARLAQTTKRTLRRRKTHGIELLFLHILIS